MLIDGVIDRMQATLGPLQAAVNQLIQAVKAAG